MSVGLVPIDDAFVRAVAPTINYGSAGALSVAGADAVNVSNQPQGRYETVMKVDVGPALVAFDAAFGAGNWTITSAKLAVTEESVAMNPIFNRGLGDFEVFWLSDDNWVEGPGTPMSVPPHVGIGNEMTWDLLQTILSSASQSSLGVFSNQLVNATLNFELAMTPPLLADLQAGGTVSLHLAPVTTTLGFNFKSSDFGVPASRPNLILSAKTTRGDVNCDGFRDLNDVDAFVLALLDPAQFTYCDIGDADVNADGLADGRDVPALICAILP